MYTPKIRNMKRKQFENLKNNGIENIHKLISNYVEIDESEWEYCYSRLKSTFFPKKSMLLNQNEICGKIFFVAGGLLRIYYADEKGEEKTFHFCLEGTFGVDYESFLKNIPSSFSIQAVEDTLVIEVTFEMLQTLYSTLRNGEKLGRLITEDYFFILNDKIKAFYMHSPLERYETMNTQFPTLLQRVPQYHIASYLNISSVHLSRLKYASKIKNTSND